MVITSRERDRLTGYDAAPNYHAGWKPELNIHAELCSLAESSEQGHFPDKANHMCSGTLSRQRQAETGKPL